MRALILAFAVGLAFAPSTEAASVWRNTTEIGLGASPLIELVRDGCGRGWHRDHWRDQWAIGTGAAVFRTGIPRMLGPQVGAIPTEIGARHRLNRSDRRALEDRN